MDTECRCKLSQQDSPRKNIDITSKNHDSLLWDPKTDEEYEIKSMEVGILSTLDEDIRSLRELIIYGIKGMAAYAKHAENLGFQDEEIHEFMMNAMNNDIGLMSEFSKLVEKIDEHCSKLKMAESNKLIQNRCIPAVPVQKSSFSNKRIPNSFNFSSEL